MTPGTFDADRIREKVFQGSRGYGVVLFLQFDRWCGIGTFPVMLEAGVAGGSRCIADAGYIGFLASETWRILTGLN